MAEEQHLHAIELSGHYYVLVQKVKKETMKSIVWKAFQWPAEEESLCPEVTLIQQSPSEYLDSLKTEWDSPDLTDLPFEEPSGGRWAAIKVPRPGHKQEIIDEGQRLRKLKDLSSQQPDRVRVIPLITDLSQTDDTPILIMEWASGVQGTELSPFEDELRGLTVALKLADLIKSVLLSGIILTDTIKADGIFYDQQADSLTLIDWNTVGQPEDFRHQTVPIFGQTLYRLFTGELISFTEDSFDVKGSRIGDDKVAERWDSLTYDTRALITDLLLGKVSGTRPDQLATEIFDRIKAQIDLWGASTSSLLASARTNTATACLNYYDLAQAQGADLTAEDRKRYNQAVQEVLWKHQAGEHDTALAFINWARRRCPEDEEVRWAWLAHRVAKRRRGVWTPIEPALAALRYEAYDRAQSLLEKYETLEFKALVAEAKLRSRLRIGDQWPTVDQAEENKPIYEKLDALWKREEGGESLADLYGEKWMESLEQQVNDYQKRVKSLRKQLSENSQEVSISKAVETLKELSREQPESEGLRVWMQAAEDIQKEQEMEALKPLTARDDDVSDMLMRIAVEKLKQRAEVLADEDHYQDAVELLEPVGECCSDDAEVREKIKEYGESASKYKAQWQVYEKAQGEQNFEGQGKALWDLLKSGFRRASDEFTLVELWLESQLEWAKQRINFKDYTAAIRIADDTLQKLKDLDLSSEDKDLREEAKEQFKEINQQRKDVAEQFFKEAREWMQEKENLGLDEALTRAMTALAQARRYDPIYSEDGIRAFKRGRELLVADEPNYALAVTELNRALLEAWDELRKIIRPYAKIAQVGAALSNLPDELERASPEELVGVIDECNELNGILDNVDESVPEKRWQDDTQVNDLHEELVTAVQGKRTEAHKKLNKALEAWLDNVAHADAALDDQAMFADLDRALPLSTDPSAKSSGGNSCSSPICRENPSEDEPKWQAPSEPEDTETSQEALEAWSRRVRTLYNLALAQAHLLKAEMDLKLGREDLVEGRYEKARCAAEEAEQGGYTGPWPNDRPATETLRGAITHHLRYLWTEAYEQAVESGKISAGLQFVQDLVQNSARDLARLSKQYLEASEVDLHDALNEAFGAWEEGDKQTFVNALAVPLESWDNLLQIFEDFCQEKKEGYVKKVDSFTRTNFVKRTWLVLQGHIGQELKPARDTAEELTDSREGWDQVLQAAFWGAAASIVVLVLSLGLIAGIVAYAVSSNVRSAVVSPFVSPTAIPTPDGRLTIESKGLYQAGTEARHTVTIKNTGRVTATFEISPVSSLPLEVVWREREEPLTSTLDSWPRTRLGPQESKTWWLTVPRTPSGTEPGIKLVLMVEGGRLYVGYVVPSEEQLEILGWDMNQGDEEYVQGIDLQASGTLTPSIAGQYGLGCYDGDGNQRSSIPPLEVEARKQITFECSLREGVLGEWHVAAFPLGADEHEEWSPPDSRICNRFSCDGFPYEHAFTVREPYYGLTITQPITPLFDPDPKAQVVGLRYEIRNTGEVSDAVTVEFKPITNTTRLSLTLGLPGEAATHTLELTRTTGQKSLFPEQYRLNPCLDLVDHDCPVVEMEIVAYYPVEPRKDEERWLLKPPLTFDLILKPRDGKGEPVVEHVKMTETP
jgi:hypothetical protein